MIFQGQELLENEWFCDKDPIMWSKKFKYSGIVQMYRDLIALRKNMYGITSGLKAQNINVHHINNDDKLIAFHRWEHGGAKDDVIVIANFANRVHHSYNLGFPREGLWKVRFNSDWNGYDPYIGNFHSYDTNAYHGSKDGMNFNGNIGIGAYSLIILSQDC